MTFTYIKIILSDLKSHWSFIEDYLRAFNPPYICTKTMQEKQVSLSDFYMQWLKVIQEVEETSPNPFSEKLVESFRNRLQKLKGSQAFQMAMYLDPRFNHLDSRFFEGSDKEQIQVSKF